MQKESLFVRSVYWVFGVLGLLSVVVLFIVIRDKLEIPSDAEVAELYFENNSEFQKYNHLFHANPDLIFLSISFTNPRAIVESKVVGEPLRPLLRPSEKYAFSEQELFNYHNHRPNEILFAAGKSLFTEREAVRNDLLDNMRVGKIVRAVCRTDICESNNDIYFHVYNFGFVKGIAYIENPENLDLVNDMSLYGTEKDPRIGLDNSPQTVHKIIEGNWYLFGG